MLIEPFFGILLARLPCSFLDIPCLLPFELAKGKWTAWPDDDFQGYQAAEQKLSEVKARHADAARIDAALLGRLADTSPGAAGSQAWPKSAKGLLSALRRVAPALRAGGITVEHGRTEYARTVTVCKARLEV